MYWLKDYNVRVSLLLRMGLQNIDGNFITDNQNPIAEEMLRNLEPLLCRYHCRRRFKSNHSAIDPEQIVNYSQSYQNLQRFLKNDITNMALHLKKLIRTNHPLLDTSRKLILTQETTPWGLIVLLVSKARGFHRNVPQTDYDATTGILHAQRNLAEITEMARINILFHKSILNIDKKDPDRGDHNLGNKISLLAGDYLFEKICQKASDLMCPEVSEFVYAGLRDFIEAAFIDPQDSQNRPLPARPRGVQKKSVRVPNQFDNKILKVPEVLGNAKAEWTLRHYLDGASLLAKSCQGTLLLAGHPTSVQELGHIFGRNFALALQASNDISTFTSETNEPFSLISAPLIFHLEQNPGYYDQFMKNIENNEVKYNELKKIVREGSGMEKAIELKAEFSGTALGVLEKFSNNDATTALVNIVENM